MKSVKLKRIPVPVPVSNIPEYKQYDDSDQESVTTNDEDELELVSDSEVEPSYGGDDGWSVTTSGTVSSDIDDEQGKTKNKVTSYNNTNLENNLEEEN